MLRAEVLDAERHFLGDVGEQRVILNHVAPFQYLFEVVGISAVLFESLNARWVAARWRGGRLFLLPGRNRFLFLFAAHASEGGMGTGGESVRQAQLGAVLEWEAATRGEAASALACKRPQTYKTKTKTPLKHSSLGFEMGVTDLRGG